MKILDEQVRVGLFGLFEVGGDAADLDTVEEFLFGDAHHIHGHLAGDEPDAAFACRLDHLFERGDLFGTHPVTHEARADAEEVEFRERKAV